MTSFINTTGYLNNSPHRYNPFNIIKGKNITMQGVDIPLLLRPNKGKSKIVMPNSGEYSFPKATFVVEEPLQSYQPGGTYFDKSGFHFKNPYSNLVEGNPLNDCPEGYIKDETGVNCIPDNGMDMSKQQKGLFTVPVKNAQGQTVGGTGAVQQSFHNSGNNSGESQDETKSKMPWNAFAIPAAKLLTAGIGVFGAYANSVEEQRKKEWIRSQMNNPLFNGSYSNAQNDYGVDPYEQTGQLKSTFAYGGIHINPANKGKFNALKARTGKSTEELTHSSNPLTRKRAIFAQNAAKWHHQKGGFFQQGGNKPIITNNPNDPRLKAALSKMGNLNDGEYEGEHIDENVIKHLKSIGYDVEIL